MRSTFRVFLFSPVPVSRETDSRLRTRVADRTIRENGSLRGGGSIFNQTKGVTGKKKKKRPTETTRTRVYVYIVYTFTTNVPGAGGGVRSDVPPLSARTAAVINRHAYIITCTHVCSGLACVEGPRRAWKKNTLVNPFLTNRTRTLRDFAGLRRRRRRRVIDVR